MFVVIAHMCGRACDRRKHSGSQQHLMMGTVCVCAPEKGLEATLRRGVPLCHCPLTRTAVRPVEDDHGVDDEQAAQVHDPPRGKLVDAGRGTGA